MPENAKGGIMVSRVRTLKALKGKRSKWKQSLKDVVKVVRFTEMKGKR